MKEVDQNEFGISRVTLEKMFICSPEKFKKLLDDEFKGVEGLAKSLRTDLKNGISNLDKTSVFFRKKILGSENSPKTTINHHHFYSTLLYAFLFFVLSVMKFYQMDLDEKLENSFMDFIYAVIFLLTSILIILISFTKFNKYPLKNIQISQGENFYIVIRNGEHLQMSYDELLIGDVLVFDELKHVGFISGVLIEGQLEVLRKESVNPMILQENSRIYPEMKILSGIGILT